MARRRVLLFGASGFIGTQVASALMSDPRVGELIRAGRKGGGDGSWVRHDLVEDSTERLSALFREIKPDVVINCTGRLSGSFEELTQSNVLVTARLLDAMAALPAGRLVVLGSAGEYGRVPFGQQVGEDAPESPVSAYGVTKLAGTSLVRAAARGGRVDAVSLRTFNPIGPGCPTENVLGRAAANLRAAIAAGEDQIRLGPLGAYRDFVDVRDVASAVAKAALADRLTEPVLNVGSGEAATVRTAIDLLVRVAGFTGAVLEENAPPVRSGAVNWIAADPSRVQRVLGWAPTYDLRDSVKASWGA